MRDIPAGFAAHLATGVTTLCHCWRVTARQGDRLGFTDHDRDISFDGTIFEAQSGFTASELEQSLGLSIDNLDASGALQSDRLSAGRIEAGDFDGAQVEVWRVNWQDPAQRLLLRRGWVGEVTRSDGAFTAEIRGLTAAFDEPRGRLLQFGCDAILGDARCGIDLGNILYQGPGAVVSAAADQRLIVTGLSGFADKWFSRGTLNWSSGANAGRTAEIKTHGKSGGTVEIELWQPAAFAIAAGDSFTARAGCDKQFATCRQKFSNQPNFRGFPHIPGDDFALTYARRDDPHNDGKSLQ